MDQSSDVPPFGVADLPVPGVIGESTKDDQIRSLINVAALLVGMLNEERGKAYQTPTIRMNQWPFPTKVEVQTKAGVKEGMAAVEGYIIDLEKELVGVCFTLATTRRYLSAPELADMRYRSPHEHSLLSAFMSGLMIGAIAMAFVLIVVLGFQ